MANENVVVTATLDSGVNTSFAADDSTDVVYSVKVFNPNPVAVAASISVPVPYGVDGANDTEVSVVEVGTVTDGVAPTTLPVAATDVQLDPGSSITYVINYTTDSVPTAEQYAAVTVAGSTEIIEVSTDGTAANLAGVDASVQAASRQEFVLPTITWREDGLATGSIKNTLLPRDASGHRSLDETAVFVALLGAHEPATATRVLDAIEQGVTLDDLLP